MRTEKLSDEWFEYTSACSTVSGFYGGDPTSVTSSHTGDESMDTQSPAEEEKENGVSQYHNLV